ncbi:DUF305 domain-containing protein [Isoptericola sp. b408]|uniref:DUF305 domain-containing protein n=1 Tax=Isoptericola sp. b408 TaxID=3064653 RepID=UPI0027129C01|nr:DUF305 domain-containing protein [Isoptericola sp. b408]MDO8152586.1 DUF305 domain-containing protein [Isoptericola sp. b408]
MTARSTAAALGAALTLTVSACAADGPTAPDDHNRVDVMFAQMMIPHHVDAIAMSQALLQADGVDAEVRDLARSVAGSQSQENTRMNDWLGARELERVDDTVPEITAQDLEAVPADELQEVFLRQMTVHHEHGVQMADRVVTDGSSTEMVELAAGMGAAQTAEIEQMADLLAAASSDPEESS